MIVSYELLGQVRGSGAARDRPQLLRRAARRRRRCSRPARSGGARGYWRERLAALDRVVADDAADDPLRLRRACLRSSDELDDAIDHLERAGRAQQRQRRVPRRRARRSRRCTAEPRLRARCSGGLACPVRPWLQHRIQRRHNRHRNAGARRPAHDRSLQRLDFDPLALRQIDQQRRPHRLRECRRRTPRCAR